MSRSKNSRKGSKRGKVGADLTGSCGHRGCKMGWQSSTPDNKRICRRIDRKRAKVKTRKVIDEAIACEADLRGE